jgi:rhomboid protease GluP
MIRVIRTMLSYPPRKNAAIVAAASGLILTIGSAIASNGYEDLMSASRELVFDKNENWRLFTTLFVHADIGHLSANLLLYLVLSFLLYGYYGALVYPFLCWALAIPMTAIALTTYPHDTMLIGASGLVYLMGGVWLSLYLLVATNKSLWARILRAGGVMLAIFFPTSYEEKVSYRVHFIGLAIGLAAGAIYHFLFSKALHSQELKVLEIDDESPIEFNNLDDLEQLDPP